MMEIFERIGNGERRILIGYPILVTKRLIEIVEDNDVTLFFVSKDFYSKFYDSMPRVMTAIGKIISARNLEAAFKLDSYRTMVDEILGGIKESGITHVMLNSNMWHPTYLNNLKRMGVITVTKIVDDPEGSRHYSEPVVRYYDKCICSGISYDKNRTIEDMYYKWGAEKVKFLPVFIAYDHYDHEPIDYSKKDIEVVHAGVLSWKRWIAMRYINKKLKGRILFCSHYDHRKNKGIVGLIYRTLNFFLPLPETKKVSDEELKNIYKRSKIGLNMHLSYGPSNARTYELCLNGILQITNNEKGYKSIYSVGEEVVCYKHIKEAVKLIDFYLKNKAERDKIAKAGYDKAKMEYTYEVIFDKHLKYILEK